jgi:methylthioribose-1-phosphate isomerase
MNLNTISPNPDFTVSVLDQRLLPHVEQYEILRTVEDCIEAIADMWVRGAPLIGVTAAFGMAYAAREAQENEHPEGYFQSLASHLASSRPTAVNLQWAIDRQLALAAQKEMSFEALWDEAVTMLEEDAAACRRIAEHGLPLLQAIFSQTKKTVNVLTHCNAGALATVAWGTATAPVYLAHAQGIPVHVWVDETRPRNQGAHLTAWELAKAGVPHTVISDNAGGHLMQQGKVDIVITGADRVAANGDAANKIGTYLKALAAKDNDIPFYIAYPESTLDASIADGLRDIPIEERSTEEVTHIQGWDEEAAALRTVRLTPSASAAANPAFDVTPARLITGYITDSELLRP